MTHPTERCLRLLGLLPERVTWSGEDLAAELDVTVRTVRRDIDRLRDLGYAVDSERGHLGGYRLAQGRALPPLVLADDEAVALALALRTAASGPLAGTGDAALRALGKLEATLPGRLRTRVDGLRQAISVAEPLGSTVSANDLVLVAEAVRATQRLRFSYRSGSGEESARWVEPYRLLSYGRRWYLSAWDVDRRDWRLFRLDRVGALEVSGWTFRHRPDEPDPAERLRTWAGDARYAYEVVVRVDATYDEVAAAFGRWAEVTRDEDGTPSLVAGADSAEGLARWLAGFPWQFWLVPDAGRRTGEVVRALRGVADRIDQSTEALP